VADGLRVHLDAPLPDRLAVGAGTALFVCGWCVAPAGSIAELTFVVDGVQQPVAAQGMPRLDVLRALHPSLDPFALRGVASDPSSTEDSGLNGYRCGFWGTVTVLPSAAESCQIELRARLDGGDHVSAQLARIPVVDLPAALAVPDGLDADGPLVAICMATYEPPLDLLTAQIESIRAQTHERWVCVISDDCSSPERLDEIRAATSGDPRFAVDRSSQRLGFYRNFERALALAPAQAQFVALADQDDAWDPDKLQTLLEHIGDAQLVYSDARIVSRDGEPIADTYWADRENNYEDLFSLLVANSVTGAASLLRRELLDDALPFPPAQFAHYHDHWLALVALSLGDIAYVDRPLYDYVQHGDASLGHAAAVQARSLSSRVRQLRSADPKERVRTWRAYYFVDVARLTQVVTVLQLRCAPRMKRAKRRALQRFARIDRSLAALAGLWVRGARELVGRPKTLGAEWTLACAFTWRRLLTAVARKRPVRALRLDAVPPAAFLPRAGPTVSSLPAVREVAMKVAPLRLAITDDAPARINVLIPSVDLKHFFGGYIAKFNLALRLARRGLRVRIVTVDPQPPLPRGWMEQLAAYDGLDGFADLVEVAFGRETTGIEVSRGDRFVASTWWSAHIADAAAQSLGGEPFVYLIQEYEPFTFPMSTNAAMADGSYALPHVALFSTELLRDYFRRQGLGVYAGGGDEGDRASLAFQNAITDVPAPSAQELAQRSSKRLLFYARPEPHAARNMFELGVLALGRALDLGAFRGGWELRGIGTVELGGRVDIGGGAAMEMVPRAQQRAYADVLRECDVGLSLMYTPHPSLVPIEMASAGMLTVTNTCANKTADAMRAISENLITVPPTVDALAHALAEATAAIDDRERRARGARVAWSRDWDTSFDDALLDRVVAWLTPAN
jgi:hypothetical protein